LAEQGEAGSGLGRHPLPWQWGSEGPAKKKDGPPVHLLNPRPTYQLFFLAFCFSTFLLFARSASVDLRGVLGFFQSNRQKFKYQFFLDSFLFFRGFGCFLAAVVQKHYKKRFTKNRVEKFVQKNRQKSKTAFSRFSVRGFKKRHKNIKKINLTYPITTGN
jgi:hypothetical protein